MNRKCIQCKKECKQFKQIKVVYCPKFVAIPKKGVTIKGDEMRKTPSTATSGESNSQVGVNGQEGLKAPDCGIADAN